MAYGDRFLSKAKYSYFVKFFIFYFLFFISNLFAEGEQYIPAQNATVQIMNKQAGKVQTITIPVGKNVKFEKLEIMVRKCLSNNEFLPEDFYMFAEIGKSGKKIFSGWMTKSEPGQNPLQDPDNDLWLVKCE
jgi:hypothetical protein